jgi:hypothetical protein
MANCGAAAFSIPRRSTVRIRFEQNGGKPQLGGGLMPQLYIGSHRQ